MAPARLVSARAWGSLARPGLTLLELLLALSLIVVLAGAFVLNLAGRSRSAEFDEGLDRFRTTLRLMRAEAANCGRRFRISPDAQSGAPLVEWEADPLAKPGQFAPYTVASWQTYVPTDLVTITRSELTGPSAYRVLTSPGLKPKGEPESPAVVFYPDGSSDFAAFTLASTNPDDARRMLVELNGLTGEISTRQLTEEEAASQPEAQ